MFAAQQISSRTRRHPGKAAQFTFQLACRPTGAADEGTHHSTRPTRLGQGFCRRNLQRPAQALLRTPPKRGKGQLVVRHWPTLVNDQLSQKFKILPLQEIPDRLIRWAIENQPESTLLCRVFCQQNHRTMKNPIPQRRIRQQQLPLERNRNVG